MSRPSGPGVPPNGWPVDQAQADGQNPYNDPYYAQRQAHAQQQAAAAQQAAQQAAQTAGRQPRIQTGQPPRAPQVGLPPVMQPGYAQPGQPNAPYVPPQPQYAPPAPQQAYAQPQYAPPQPQPQAYAPPTQPTRPAQDPRYGAYPGPDYGTPAQRAPAPQPGYPQGYAAPQAPAVQQPAPQAYVPEQTARKTAPPSPPQAQTYEPWPTQAPVQPAADPHGYDLGNYMPMGAPSAAPRGPQPVAPQPAPMYAELPTQRGQALPRGYSDAAQGGYPQPSLSVQDDHGALAPVSEEEEYDDEEEYEEPRKTRYGLIAASLLGAIVAGGGLAYAYKVFVAPQSQVAGAMPVIKSSSGPAKIKPTEPGGTQFANKDSKMMESLADAQGGNPGAPTATSPPANDGPRAVQTIVIPRDPPRVPGMILQGGPTAPPVAAAPTPAPAPPVAAAPPPAAQSAPPKKVALAAAVPAPVGDAAEPPAAAPVAPKKQAVPKAPKAALGGPPAATGANGFVAVLASMPATESSKSQAMQQFADLQQKFAGVLGGKAPDVVDVKLADKGDYHRLIVGPPASKASASTLCTQLKAAGYTADCWVTPF